MNSGAEEPFEVPITDVFDLHAFAPRDMKAALEAYLDEAVAAGFKAVRIIHGRGIGAQGDGEEDAGGRAEVVSFGDAPAEAGLGATVVTLRLD